MEDSICLHNLLLLCVALVLHLTHCTPHCGDCACICFLTTGSVVAKVVFSQGWLTAVHREGFRIHDVCVRHVCSDDAVGCMHCA